jgi:hypothetical protein
MCHEGAKCLVSPETADALDALLRQAIMKASQVIASEALEPKETIAAVKVIAEASKAAADAVAKGNGVPRPAPAAATSPSGEPIYTLNDAVSEVCKFEKETAVLEPWARVITRINRLFQRVETDLEKMRSSDSSDSTRERVASPASESGCRAGVYPPPYGNLDEETTPPFAPISSLQDDTEYPDYDDDSEYDDDESSLEPLGDNTSGTNLSSGLSPVVSAKGEALAKVEVPPTSFFDLPLDADVPRKKPRAKAPT